MNAIPDSSLPAGPQRLAFMAWLLLACLLAFPAGKHGALADPWQALHSGDSVQSLEGLPRQDALYRQLQRVADPEDGPDLFLLSKAFRYSALARSSALPLYAHLDHSPARLRPAPQFPRAPPLSA